MELVSWLVLVGGGTAVVAALAFNYFATPSRRKRRALRRLRVDPIAKLVDGPACIVGRVESAGEPLAAKRTKTRCVAYETIEIFYGKYAQPGLVDHVDVERRVAAFDIVDDTGRARVDAPAATMCHRAWSKSRSHEERIVRVGDRVRLAGTVVLQPASPVDADGGFRDGCVLATVTGSIAYPIHVDVEEEGARDQ
jgi:hypothetical protein